jgi:hypothetical protein
MKTVKFLSLLLIGAFLLVSCKQSKNDFIPHKNESAVEIGMTDSENLNETIIDNESTYLYVTASTGLSLREYANLQSKKLGIMPYGTKLKVIETETDPTMNIGGIIGGMDQVEFNHKTGYAFNGYLSKFFPPELDISVKGYAQELKKIFPKVVYTENVGGSASAPTNTETIILPTKKWHEAFFIAQKLFEIPKEFKFPKPTGKNIEIIKDSKPEKNIWVSELRIYRNNKTTEKIEYTYSSKGYSKLVTIINEGDSMKISKTEEVK